MGYTFVSIGRLDECGYTTTFRDVKCIIHVMAGDKIGHIPRSGKGLYKVVHDDGESSFAATEKLTIMELHCHMGHIAPAIAKKLVDNGFVTGVHLNTSSDESIFL